MTSLRRALVVLGLVGALVASGAGNELRIVRRGPPDPDLVERRFRFWVEQGFEPGEAQRKALEMSPRVLREEDVRSAFPEVRNDDERIEICPSQVYRYSFAFARRTDADEIEMRTILCGLSEHGFDESVECRLLAETDSEYYVDRLEQHFEIGPGVSVDFAKTVVRLFYARGPGVRAGVPGSPLSLKGFRAGSVRSERSQLVLFVYTCSCSGHLPIEIIDGELWFRREGSLGCE